jgi:hypothetical protein
MWGPYEITKDAFDRVVKRKHLLESGTIKYRADDRLYWRKQTACNCFHAMASLEKPFPDGGPLGTGFKVWGLNGTRRVLLEYKFRAAQSGLLLEPVDVENDRYGFVHVPARDARRGVYNPFEHASAYRR